MNLPPDMSRKNALPPPEMLLVIVVKSIPAPCIVIDFPLTVTLEVHVAEPAGRITMSPSSALLTAARTSIAASEAAVMVVPKPGRGQIRRNVKEKSKWYRLRIIARNG